MEIEHSWKGQRIKGEGSTNFLLTNKDASYLNLGIESESNYQGWIIQEETGPHKLIENIRLETKFKKLTNKISYVERQHEKGNETFHLAEKAILYKITNYEGSAKIKFDVRGIHDYSTEGRKYEIEANEDHALIKYSKGERTDYIIVQGIKDTQIIDGWEEQNYSYDKSRGIKSDFWVYKGIKFFVRGNADITIVHGRTREETYEKLEEVINNKENIRERQEKYAEKTLTEENIESNLAIRALDRLTVRNLWDKEKPSIIAGYPWFVQVWSRDELISVGAYIKLGRFYITKEILQRNLEGLKKGILPNRIPESQLGTADGTGWLWKRWLDYLEALKKKNQIKDFLTKEELESLLVKLELSIEQTMENNQELVGNEAKETWIDTDVEGKDTRAGARIEIQTLWLSACKLHEVLSEILKKPKAQEIKLYRERLQKKTKELLFRKGKLADGIENGKLDTIQRPNIFIAAYTYPELLNKQEWKQALVACLDETWLDWGGISSISKNNELFKWEHTGINNLSYHRGDSWYWINNLGAIVLNKLDNKLFHYYIEKIKRASIKEMTHLGNIGHCAEISNAAELSSKGCWAQAWSAAMLVELIIEKP